MSSPPPMPIHYDNQVAIFITGNFTIYKHIKHIEIDCHYIQDGVIFGVISTSHVTLSHKLVDVFTKSLTRISYDVTCTKLTMFNLYAPA